MNETVTNAKNEEVLNNENKDMEDKLAKLEREKDATLESIFKLLNIDAKVKEVLPKLENKIEEHLSMFSIGMGIHDKKLMKKGIRFFETLEELDIIEFDVCSTLRDISSLNKGKSKKNKDVCIELRLRKGLSEEEFKKDATKQIEYQLKSNNAPAYIINNIDKIVEGEWQKYKIMNEKGIVNNE